MPAFVIPLAMMAASAISGALANRNKNQQTSTTMPQIDPKFQGLQNMIMPSIMNRLQQPSALPAGFQETGTEAINDTFKGASMNLDNQLRNRGLSRSPIAGRAVGNLESKRFSDINKFKTQLPMMERDLQNQDLQQAMQLLAMGRSGGSITTNTSAGPGALNGGISGMAQMLGFLYGSGAFGATGGVGASGGLK